MTDVMIGVQARSTSTRFPGKCLEPVDDKTIIDHVLAACKSATTYINKGSHRSGVKAFIALLVPEGDPLADYFQGQLIVEGSEHDVLKRYLKAMRDFMPDYVCRITGDCPLLNPALISKCIISAAQDRLDYISNVWPATFVDGHDVEVISSRAMRWLEQCVDTPHDREHVTTYLKSNTPGWMEVGSVIGHLDLSDINLSVDTKEDLELVKKYQASLNSKIAEARKGNRRVYRF